MKIIELDIIEIFESVSRDDLLKNLRKKQEKEHFNMILRKMHELVLKHGDRQSISGYAFDISRYLGGAISPRDLEKMYRKEYMNESQINEWGRIVKGVNTTVDVGTDEIKKQAAKFGNTVDKDGRPPTLSKKVKGKSTNVLYNLGLSEGVYYNNDILVESVLYEGFLDSAKQFLGNRFNQTAADIKGAITDVKDAGVLIKDIVSNNDYLTKVNVQLNKTVRGYVKKLTQLASKSTLLSSLWDRIKSVINSFISTTGWKGFLGRLATVGFLKFIVTNAANIKDNVVGLIIDKIVDLEQLLPMATLGPFLQIFQGLVQVKEFFLDTLTNIKQKLEFGKNIQRNSKYNDYELALMEGGHTLEETAVEPKKPGRLFKALSNEAFDTEVEWVEEKLSNGASVYAAMVDDAYIEITYKPMSKGVYINFTRSGNMSVTGEGRQNKIFGAVINHIKQWVAKNKPQQIVFSAWKPRTGAFGAQDTTRSGLYRKMLQRFASQNGYDYDVEDTGNEDTFILKRQDLEENFADGKKISDSWFKDGFKTYKVPAKEKYVIADKDGTVQTLEGPVKYKKGYYIMTGPKGEKYPIPPEKFKELKDDHGNGIASPKKIIKIAKLADHDGSINTSWGATLHYKKGNDYIVRHGPNDYGVVKSDIFKQTYKQNAVEENFADGKKPGRKGLAKRSGVNTKASVSSLRKTAKNSSGEKQRMAHWLANMKAGKAKKK